jgi:hypothetical protein
MMEPQYSEHETALALFGKTVYGNTFGCKLTATEESTALAILRASFALLDSHTREFTTDDVAAMLVIEEVIIPSSDQTDLGETGRNAADGRFAATFSLAYLQAASTAWIASCFRHEAQHYRNRGKYSGADAWRDEQTACQAQLPILTIVDAPPSEIAYLESYSSDANADGMEQHMVKGYAGPPLQSA